MKINYNYRIVLIALSCVLFWAVSLCAEENSEKIEELLVTANRLPLERDKIGSSMSIISNEEIQKKNKPTVLELLRSVAGVEVVQSGGMGKVSSTFIRGSNSDHVLVLINGVRLNDNNQGQFDFSSFKTDNVEYIEILKGSQSVLYGSEAIGGVINIITKKAEEEGYRGQFTSEGGSRGTQHHRGRFSSADEVINSSTEISYFSTDGISAARSDNGNPEKDSHENLTLSTHIGFRSYEEDDKADLIFRYSKSKDELDDFDFQSGPVDDLNYEQENEAISGSLKIEKSVLEWLNASVELGIVNNHLAGKDPSKEDEFNNFHIDSNSKSILAKLDFIPEKNTVVSFGYGFDHRKGENKGNFDKSRDISSFFLQINRDFAKTFYLSAGVRNDKDSGFGNKTTFRTTASWVFFEGKTRLHSSFGTGFKAPSFNELFFPNFGNSNLKAETSWSYDIGVEQKFYDEDVIFDLTFFQTSIDDLIEFDETTLSAHNIDRAKIFGFENTLHVKVNEVFKMNMSYSYTHIKSNEILPRRPKHKGAMDLYLEPMEDFQGVLSSLLLNSRKDIGGIKLDNYQIFDLSLSYTLTDEIKTRIRLENLFDKDYEEVRGYGTLGFSAYAGIEVSL